MREPNESLPETQRNRLGVLLAGALIGALVGTGAAYLLVQRADRNEEELKMSTGDGIKLGLLVFGLLRQVAQLGDGD